MGRPLEHSQVLIARSYEHIVIVIFRHTVRTTTVGT